MGSWLVSLLLVAAAGAITWHGTGAAAGTHPDPASTATIIASVDAPALGFEQQPLPGALPTRLVVPSAGIDTAVREVGAFPAPDGSLAWETAWDAAGHHLDSARPGQPGNVVISGHVSVANADDVAVFATLDRVAEGDHIEVFAGNVSFRYRVTGVRVVAPGEVDVLRSGHQAEITLITCTRDLEHRLVVTGVLT